VSDIEGRSEVTMFDSGVFR